MMIKAPAHSTQHPSFLTRVKGLAQRNPWAPWSLLHYEFRNSLGFDLNRRLYPEKSFLPSYVSLSLTRRCNLKCKMCIQHRNSPARPENLQWYRPDQELPLEAWVALFDELAKWRPIVFITGGEPLLYPHILELLELLEEAKKRNLLVHLQTNGVLLDKVADQVVSLGVEMVTVSLDGPLAVHDLVRGEGNFHRSARGLLALEEARSRQEKPGPLAGIFCTISKDNLAHLGETVDLALELGVDLIQFTHTIFTTPDLVEQHNGLLNPDWAQARGLTLVPPSIPAGEFYESEIGPEDIPLLQEGLQEVHRRAPDRIKVQFSPHLPLNLVSPYYLDLDYPFPQVCKSLWKTCRILPDGTISPCLHLVMGNITTEPLSVIWNNSRMRRWRKFISKRLLPGCVRCCHRSFA